MIKYEQKCNVTCNDNDNTVEAEGYIPSLTLVGTARTATVTAGISSGAVTEVFLNNDGSGYRSAPTITFSSPPVGFITATAVGITTRVANVQSLLRIELTNAGSGYVTPPTITISGGSGTGAAATCSIGGTLFSVSSLSITDRGNGYATAPVVTIGSPGTGTTATAIAGINTNTEVDSIRILNAGIGYTEGEAPTVSVAGFSTIGVGTFIYNEIVTGQLSGTTARVRDFRTVTSPFPGVLPVTNLRVSLNTGKFSAGEIIVGSISSARYVVSDYDTESYDNPYDVNEEIETEADDILDFTESNPFGTY